MEMKATDTHIFLKAIFGVGGIRSPNAVKFKSFVGTALGRRRRRN
jgi:hypothetical protein